MSKMSSPPATLVIATRQSALALWQAQHVRERLRVLYPSCRVDLLGLTTQGDRTLDQPLAAIGGKGLFIKELEQAIGAGRADLAVHSLKDVPMAMAAGFSIAAVMAREDPRDAFVSNAYESLAALPPGSVVGTSSLRREAQLRKRYPKLLVEPLRGNVNTRLHRLDQGEHAAVILAAAGLMRLGFADRIKALLEPEESLPAIGQGALAVECRANREDLAAALEPLADTKTTLATAAERAFGHKLGASCRTPLAAHAIWRGDMLWLRGFIASRDGSHALQGEHSVKVAAIGDAAALGEALGDDFLARGAATILAEAS